MTQDLQQTPDDEAPPIPKFKLSLGKKEETSKSPDVPSMKDSNGEEIVGKEEADSLKEIELRKEKTAKPKKSVSRKARIGENDPIETDTLPFEKPKQYKNLSTKVRDDIQDALAELQHRRKQAKMPHSIKSFIEEAVQHWLESNRAKLSYIPKQNEISLVQNKDTFKTFNNEIEEELKLKLDEVCYYRSKVNHPFKTIIALLDDAFRLWLPLQEELPEDLVRTVLEGKQSQAEAA